MTHVCMKFTKTLLNTLIVLFIIYYPVPSRYTVSHISVKIPSLVAYFSTKGNIFTVNQYMWPGLQKSTMWVQITSRYIFADIFCLE